VPIDELHRQVAAIALRAASKHGFALGGGNALRVHGLTDRPTQDVDLFTNRPGAVRRAAGPVEAALAAEGFGTAQTDLVAGLDMVFGDGMNDGLAEWVVTAPDGRQMVLQLALFDRRREPGQRKGIGRVLHRDDVAAGKVVALCSRSAPRDYDDVYELMRAGYTTARLIALARDLDPGLTDQDVWGAARHLDRTGDGWFGPLRMPRGRLVAIRRAFAIWPRG
jgi:hypothetical protein